MLKLAFFKQYIVLLGLIVVLTGCHKDQKKVIVEENRGFTMPFGAPHNESFACEDVEEFVLEEDNLTNPFDPELQAQTRLAYGQEEQPLQDFTLEQLDAKDEMHVIYFPYDSKQLAQNQLKTLRRTAKNAQELYKQGRTICCKGHACQWHGTDAYNMALSYQRAYTIADYLAQEAHIPKDKIKVVGVGNEEPVAFEESLEGQAPNRRVEVYATAA